MRDRLRHVRWIGGGSGSGKSTVAKRLAQIHGLAEYSTDDMIPEHARRLSATAAPLLQTFLTMDLNERWVARPPRLMFETFPWFHGEGFEEIVADLTALPAGTLILAEGFRLLPRLVAPLLSGRDQAVWLIPTEEFRRRAFDARGPAWFPSQTSDPERALVNVRVRDSLFTNQVLAETANLGLCTITVDGVLGVEELATRVAESLGLVSPSAV